MKKIIFLVLLIPLLLTNVWAQQVFVVKHIEFQGLQRISANTAISYLPIKQGQTLRPDKTAGILRALYQTGFFDHITLSKEGNTLIIHVIERPTIGLLKIKGNSVVPTDKLTSVMKSVGIAEGLVYNPSMLEKIRQSLLNQYYLLGRYNARVEMKATPMSRNRVMVNINISEGLPAKIKHISIIGNHVFSESTLIKQMDISTTGLFTFFTQSDRYSEEKLEASIDKLRGYYMDRGYLRVEIKSSQAELTPDRKSVYITIVVTEGEPYVIKGFEVTGDMVLPYDEFIKRIHLRPGERFSRQKVIDAEKAMTTYLGDNSYLFASIALRPEINDKTHTVILKFDIRPGKRAYVRNITFSDNTRTNDVVLRREVEQMEGAPASNARLDESKQRLKLLPYLKDVDMSVKPVPQIDDQVDVNYKVTEKSSAQISARVGYSQIQHVIYGVGLNQDNFFGTGNSLGINFQRSRYEQNYSMSYTNPYYTADGISRSFNASIIRVDPRGAGLNNGYTMDEYNLGVQYGIPIGQESGIFSRVHAGAYYQNYLIDLISDTNFPASNQVLGFVKNHGTHFQQLDLKLGYSRDSRDKAFFPTSGGIQSIFLDAYAPLERNSPSFYMINYNGKWWYPLSDQFIFVQKAEFGYGNALNGVRNFPFFKNYYAGGIDSVRGYQGYTLGPRDSNARPFGANMLADASMGLIFPNFISDNLRTSWFVDAGNVYSSLNNKSFGGASTNTGPIRFSTGLEADIITPFGPFELSLAKAINKRPHDDIEVFQLSIGANF